MMMMMLMISIMMLTISLFFKIRKKDEVKIRLNSNDASPTEFNKLVQELGQIRLVTVNAEKYLLSRCTCPFWLKNLVCKHVLVVCFARGLCTFPALEKEIESNAKRGRKKGYVNGLTRAEYIAFNNQLFPCERLALPVNEPQACTSSSFIRETAAAITPEVDDEQGEDVTIATQSKKRCLVRIGNKVANSTNEVVPDKKQRGRPRKIATTN